jgi:hypothetical protein
LRGAFAIALLWQVIAIGLVILRATEFSEGRLSPIETAVAFPSIASMKLAVILGWDADQNFIAILAAHVPVTVAFAVVIYGVGRLLRRVRLSSSR